MWGHIPQIPSTTPTSPTASGQDHNNKLIVYQLHLRLIIELSNSTYMSCHHSDWVVRSQCEHWAGWYKRQAQWRLECSLDSPHACLLYVCGCVVFLTSKLVTSAD